MRSQSPVPEGAQWNLPVVNHTFTVMTVINAPPLSLAFKPSRRFNAKRGYSFTRYGFCPAVKPTSEEGCEHEK